jgi:ABC-type sugar transport system substrate-binding protein
MTTTTRIIAAAIALLTLVPVAGAQATPGPMPFNPPAVKWILPPKTSPFYASEKANAEAAGYETVEHDDMSYPGRP